MVGSGGLAPEIRSFRHFGETFEITVEVRAWVPDPTSADVERHRRNVVVGLHKLHELADGLRGFRDRRESSRSDA